MIYIDQSLLKYLTKIIIQKPFTTWWNLISQNGWMNMDATIHQSSKTQFNIKNIQR